MALVPLVPPLHDRPQGEMFRALCDSLIPVFKGKSQQTQELISKNFSDLLTRKGVSPLYSARGGTLNDRPRDVLNLRSPF